MRFTKLVKTIIPSKKNGKFMTIITMDNKTYPVATAFIEAIKAKGGTLDMVELQSFNAGDYIFGLDANNKPLPATRDSSRVWAEGMTGFTAENAGNPIYVVGDTPKWTTEGHKVTGFVGIEQYTNHLKLQNLERQLAQALSI